MLRNARNGSMDKGPSLVVVDGKPSTLAPGTAFVVVLVAVIVLSTGCTGVRQWWHNDFKVGPNYCPPAAPVADQWIDADTPNVNSTPADCGDWWSVFNDPVLNHLADTARQQNLPLKVAGFRILEARAQCGVASASMFPQKQQMTGGYNRTKFSENAYPIGFFNLPQMEFDSWTAGFDAAWELDFWGRFRRGVEAADAHLAAQVENYNAVSVMIQAEVAANYIRLRALEERLALARKNIALQQETLKIVEARYHVAAVSELDVRQARANLAITETLIPALEIGHRTAQNRLCILLGMPPHDLRAELGPVRPIPTSPPAIALGIPAELLRRRPDVRRAEREVAAQSARIGIAASELYPRIAVTGTIAVESKFFAQLLDANSVAGTIGPGLQWNILNYGRIRSNVRAEDARFQQLVINYQNTVLEANEEVENALVAFLREQVRARSLETASENMAGAVKIALLQYQQGLIDYQRVLDIQRVLLQQQDNVAESRGQVALNLVAVYKALGGGWQTGSAPRTLPTARTQHDEPVRLPPVTR